MRVLLVDDSALMRTILRQVMEENGATVVGEAGNGGDAVTLVASARPDLVIMDFNMPVLNGVGATRKIMGVTPVPVVIFSNEADARLSLDALQAGAVEVLSKPDLDQFNDQRYIAQFMATLQAACRRKGTQGRTTAGGAVQEVPGVTPEQMPRTPPAVIVIGASTGGPAAVRTILQGLPKDFPVGIAVVQHIEERFDTGYAAWLNDACAVHVRLAQDKERVTPGTVLVAPGNRHLVCREGYFVLDDGPRVGNQKPAVDSLFTSAAQWFHRRVVGVLLTGMGADGADGCVAIRDAGGYTIVQDQETSFIYGMPRAAVERGGASRVLPLGEITTALCRVARCEG